MTAPQPDAREGERGVVLVITAFALVGLVGVVALVVDIVNVNQAQIRAQATADAAALAAAQDLDDVPFALDAAQEYAGRNYGVTVFDWVDCVDPEPLAVATDVPCISIDDSDSPTEIRVHLPDRRVPAFFASVLGRDGFTVSAAATAQVEWVVTDPGSPGGGPGVDPFQPGVRNGDPGGGWPACEDPNFWDVAPPEPDLDGKKKGKSGEWREYIFVFEHLDGTTTTWCGTNRYDPWGLGTKETMMPGGNSVESPVMRDVHVSCSANFASGWSTKGHPDPIADPEWRVVAYRLDKRFENGNFLACEKGKFTPLSATPPVIEPRIRLSD